MITIKNGLCFKRSYSVSIMVLALVVSSLFLLTGCSTTNDSTQDTTSQIVESTQPVDHNVDIDPVPLNVTEKTLTLEGYGATGALSDKDLTIIDMLTYAVQDEYLAHGEYLAIVEKFGNQKPYTNIISAEETHLAYLKEVYLAYELEFLTDASAEHIIIPADLLIAAETGVQAEISNISMYELFLTYDLPDNVFEVFSALKSGSDSHLISFQKQVDKLK